MSGLEGGGAIPSMSELEVEGSLPAMPALEQVEGGVPHTIF